MPFPNYHAVRLVDPELFRPGSFRIQVWSKKHGLMAVWGRLENGGWRIQSLRFGKDAWTIDDVRRWLKEKGYTPIKIEPARKADAG